MFAPNKAKRHALGFLTSQRLKWKREMNKYDSFSFVLGVRVQSQTSKYASIETFWCGDKTLMEDMTEENMIGEPISASCVDAQEDYEVYKIPASDLDYKGAEEWIDADLNPTWKNAIDMGHKVRRLIKFAWWSEYKDTEHGCVKQVYKYVKEHPDLLFSWWNTEFEDIPFDTVSLGKKENASRVIPYIHKRYVLRDPSVLMLQGDPQTDMIPEGNLALDLHQTLPPPQVDLPVELPTDVEQSPENAITIESNSTISTADHPAPPVSMHDIHILLQLIHKDDPIHLLGIEDPTVMQMAYYQRDKKVSREETYDHFSMMVSEAWRTWIRSGGESVWTLLMEKMINVHTRAIPAPIAPTKSTQPIVRKIPSQLHPRQSSRQRKIPVALEESVLDKTTRGIVKKNTKNMNKNTLKKHVSR